MPAANPLVRSIMNGKAPRARAEELIGGSKLNDVEVRKQLAAGGAAAIETSTDPMIVLARSIDAESRAVLKRYDDELTSVERTNYAKLAQAVFALKGNAAYPDATFTLRLSYGAVKGYKSKGSFVQPFTDFAGLYKHSAEHGDIYPYHLPEIWQAHKSALDLSTPFNFVTTNDITGGNSGSPIFNSRAEIVGLIFDGNIESLLGDFVYDETVNRSVGVDSRGMLEALKKIYNAQAVVAELTQ
jgi:Peptidase S46